MATKQQRSRRIVRTAEDSILALNVEPMGEERGDWKVFDADIPAHRIQEIHKECRQWGERSLFLQEGIKLKRSFANWGCEVKLARGETEGNAAFEAWEERHGDKVQSFIRHVWSDWYLFDSSVAFWRSVPQSARKLRAAKNSTAPGRLLVLDHEDCRYSDGLGLERLRVRFHLSQEELREIEKASKEMARRYRQGEVELSEEEGEYFRVLKAAKVGKGFGVPRVYALFRTLKTADSLEVADNLWGFVSRLVIRHIKIGHEVKQGQHAGKPTHFWTKRASDEVLAFFRGRMGFADFTSNFDRTIEFPFPSLDRFEKKKYDSVFQRMAIWLGPVGAFIMGQRGNEEVLMRMLRAEIAEDRRAVRYHLNEVINEVFPCPAGRLTVTWDDKIFHDTRTLAEFLKFLMASGALSQRTGLEYAGESQDQEWARKDKEGEQMQDEKTKSRVVPLYDPAHGPVEEPAGQPGRPAGKKSKATG